MPMPIPPLRPHPKVIRNRIANGARTMKEIDPAFHEWVQRCNRIAAFQIVALLVGAVGIVVIGVAAIINSL
jgi:hypothetical protein